MQNIIQKLINHIYLAGAISVLALISFILANYSLLNIDYQTIVMFSLWLMAIISPIIYLLEKNKSNLFYHVILMVALYLDLLLFLLIFDSQIILNLLKDKTFYTPLVIFVVIHIMVSRKNKSNEKTV